MSTIKATLQSDPDGTLHLPLPPSLRHRTLRIIATVEPVESEAQAHDIPPGAGEGTGAGGGEQLKGFGCLKGKIKLAPGFDEPLDDFKDYMK